MEQVAIFFSTRVAKSSELPATAYAPTFARRSPRLIISKRNNEIPSVLLQPDARDGFLRGGTEPVATALEQASAMTKAEYANVARDPRV